MLPCRCRSTTLSLFIRSIAQVDLSAAPAPSAASGKLQRSSMKSTSTTRPFRVQQTSRRFYTTSFTDPSDQEYSTSSNTISHDDNSRPTITPTKAAIVELSMEAIDALLAESDQDTQKHKVQDAQEYQAQDVRKYKSQDTRVYKAQEAHVYKAMPTTERNKRVSTSTVEESYDSPLNLLLKDAPTKKEKERDMSRIASRSIFRTPDDSYFTNKPKPSKVDADSEPASKDGWTPPPREPWMIYKEILKQKFPDGYQPLKRLSPDAIMGIRALHAQMPERYTTWVLSQEFQVSPEAIRRILKSKWRPDDEEEEDRANRWFKRVKRFGVGMLNWE